MPDAQKLPASTAGIIATYGEERVRELEVALQGSIQHAVYQIQARPTRQFSLHNEVDKLRFRLASFGIDPAHTETIALALAYRVMERAMVAVAEHLGIQKTNSVEETQ